VWDRWSDKSLLSNITKTYSLFFENSYHSGKFNTNIIIATCILSIFICYLCKIKTHSLYLCAFAIFIICLLSGFHGMIVYLLGDFFSIFRVFNFSRFYFLLPFLWLVVFSLGLRGMMVSRIMVPFVLLFSFMNIYFIINNNYEIKNNIKLIFSKKIDQPTFSEYLSSKLFENIDNYIGLEKSTYRIVSIGIQPSVSQLNGYYTLDAYMVNYDLHYKEKFRKIIENELDKNGEIKSYFDNWGNRCFIFSAELGRKNSITKEENLKISNLELNIEALKNLGGKYILSAVEISNYESMDLKFESVFVDENSPWSIFLYKVI
jgi:hypothetical protein